jgi:hypothetical protein
MLSLGHLTGISYYVLACFSAAMADITARKDTAASACSDAACVSKTQLLKKRVAELLEFIDALSDYISDQPADGIYEDIMDKHGLCGNCYTKKATCTCCRECGQSRKDCDCARCSKCDTLLAEGCEHACEECGNEPCICSADTKDGKNTASNGDASAISQSPVGSKRKDAAALTGTASPKKRKPADSMSDAASASSAVPL